MSQERTNNESPSELTLPDWAESAMGVLQYLLLAPGFAALAVGCFALMHEFNRSAEYLGFILIVPALLASVALHEYGHVLGARAMRMTPYFMHVGPVQMYKRRRGWRMRWKNKRNGYAGMVVAFVNPHEPLRRQYFVMVAAGPAMNGLVALVCLVAAHYLVHPGAGPFLWGFAAFNIALALANLVPRRKRMPTDGRHLLEMCRGFDKDSPAAAFALLCSLMMQGTTCDEARPELLDRLAGQPSPYPVLHSLFVINGLQTRGHWSQIAALEPLLEEQIAALSPDHAIALELAVGAMRCEVAFAKAMAGHAPNSPLDAQLGAEYDWTAPGLRPRLQALMAVRQGDLTLARALLQESERHMDNSIDEGFRTSEANARRAIAQEIERTSAA